MQLMYLSGTLAAIYFAASQVLLLNSLPCGAHATIHFAKTGAQQTHCAFHLPVTCNINCFHFTALHHVLVHGLLYECTRM